MAESVVRSLELAACAFLPVAASIWVLVNAWRRDKFATDFHYYVWPAARNVLHGVSPFTQIVDSAHTAVSFVYPAPAALLLAPFGLLPHTVADVVFTGLLVVATFLTLRIVGIQDRRCYGAVLIWPPVLAAIQSANVTLLLGLGLAVLWRVRHRAFPAALVVALLVALKIFLWPLGAWLIVRHGLRRGLLAAALVPAITLSAWGAIGFAGLRDYLRMLSFIEQTFGPTSYSVLALGMRLGLDESTARVLPVVAAVVIVGLALAQPRLRGEANLFALSVFAAILSSPVVWLHYYALLLVPLAILRPRFGLVWLAPTLLFFCPVGLSGPSWYSLAPMLLFAVLIATARVSVGRYLGQDSKAGRFRIFNTSHHSPSPAHFGARDPRAAPVAAVARTET